MAEEVERYRKPTRVLHWVHTTAFMLLFLTGLILFIPQLGFLAADSWTRLIHRIAAVIFAVAPLIYIPRNWKTTLKGVKEAFTWGIADLGWLKAAPKYYFLADEKAMPPQPHGSW
jgi:formate dehydrogenase subunit gamma